MSKEEFELGRKFSYVYSFYVMLFHAVSFPTLLSLQVLSTLSESLVLNCC